MPKDNIEFIDSTFKQLNDRHNNVYQFVMRYSDYINTPHDYGTGYAISMTEVHTLTYIEENPGTTITELAQYWSKTKSALSQTVGKLVEKGLVSKNKADNNAKSILLYVTEEGKLLSKAHKLYDILQINTTLKKLSERCSEEEIDNFYKVIGIFADLLLEE